MRSLVLIKLGGSLITDKGRPYTVNLGTIRRLAREIKSAWNESFRFLISHGSGSFGHTSAAKYGTADGIKKKGDVYGLAMVQQDALAINRIVNKIFLEEGLPCLSFVPSSFTFSMNGSLFRIFSAPIIEALRIDALPIVFGDVIMDEKLGCCIFSGETTLDNLIKPLSKAGYKIEKIIQCGATNGVYDEGGKTIPVITEKSFKKFKRVIGLSDATDVTGGMLHKVKESLEIARLGISSLIINGKKPGYLKKAILGERMEGTFVIMEEE